MIRFPCSKVFLCFFHKLRVFSFVFFSLKWATLIFVVDQHEETISGNSVQEKSISGNFTGNILFFEPKKSMALPTTPIKTTPTRNKGLWKGALATNFPLIRPPWQGHERCWQVTTSFTTIGSIPWMAPEVIQQQDGYGRKAFQWRRASKFVEGGGGRTVVWSHSKVGRGGKLRLETLDTPPN